jgi:hypothetical protein
MEPEAGGTRPHNALANELLPAPLAPSTAVAEDASTVKETPSTAKEFPYVTVTSRASSTEFRSVIWCDSKVCRLNLGIPANVSRSALGNTPPEIQHVNTLGQGQHHIHVMLYQHEGKTSLLDKIAENVAEMCAFRTV